MVTFLIQVSGNPMRETAAPEYIEGAKGPLMCDEPLVHGEYFNATPYWKEEGFGRYEAWQTVDAGDQALLYCTSSVDEYGSSLSHILKVGSVSVTDEDGARIGFSEVRELDPALSYQRIQREINAGRLSEEMSHCGQEGFNFKQIPHSDLDRVLSISQPRDPEENQPRESLQRIAAELSEDTPE